MYYCLGLFLAVFFPLFPHLPGFFSLSTVSPGSGIFPCMAVISPVLPLLFKKIMVWERVGIKYEIVVQICYSIYYCDIVGHNPDFYLSYMYCPYLCIPLYCNAHYVSNGYFYTPVLLYCHIYFYNKD
ncbi:hypothetical protein FKM82_017425 [Ascaphus truei]